MISEFTSTLAPMKSVIDNLAGALDTREITPEELAQAPDPQRSVLAMQTNYRLLVAALRNVPDGMRAEWLALAMADTTNLETAAQDLRDALALVEATK